MSHKLAKAIKYHQKHQVGKSTSSSLVQSRTVGDSCPHRNCIANVSTAAGTFTVLMLALFFSLFINDNNSVYAEPYALSISFVSGNDTDGYSDIASPTMELNVTPNRSGSFSKSSTSTIGVGTTSATGYSISIAAAGSDGDKLINTNDDNSTTNHLSSIESAITEEQFKALPSSGSESPYNNQWGYLPSMWDGQANTLFRPAPTVSGHVLNSTTTANTVSNSTAPDVCKRYQCDKYDLTIGARVDATQRIGTYSNTYVVYATANGTPYTIKFKDNTITLPADISANAMSSTITIPSDIPTKDGYTFLGWCTVSPTNNANGTDTCDGTTYQPNGSWSITEGASTNNLTLYAMWSGNYTIDTLTANGNTLYMQDFATMSAEKKAKIISSMTTGTAYTVKDTRHASNEEEPEYKIAKLKDGNVWMLDNLRLGSNDEAIALTAADTNLNGDFSLPQGVASSFWDIYSARLNAAYKDDVVTLHSGQGSGKIGVYYNYCAASAGTYCANDGTGIPGTLLDVQYDICPAGWRLPTGSGASGSEYQALIDIYGSNGSLPNADSLQYNLSVPLSGYFASSQEHLERDTNFWTATYYGLTEGGHYSAYRFFAYYNGTAQYTNYADAGFPIRCILE